MPPSSLNTYGAGGQSQTALSPGFFLGGPLMDMAFSFRSKAESVFFAISALFRSCCSAGYYKRRKEEGPILHLAAVAAQQQQQQQNEQRFSQAKMAK